MDALGDEILAAQRHACFDFDELDDAATLDTTSGCVAHAAKRHACFDFDELDDAATDEDKLSAAPASTSTQVPAAVSPKHMVLDANACSAPGAVPTEASIETNRATYPLFFADRGLESGELIEDREGLRAAPVYIYTDWHCSESAARLCGQYVPLCRRSAQGCVVDIRLSHDDVVRGTDTHPLYILLQPSWCRNSALGVSGKRPLLVYRNQNAVWVVVKGDDGVPLAWVDRLDPSATWIVWTSVARETEFGMHALRTRNPRMWALAAPAPWPKLALDSYERRLSVRVICLPKRKDNANVALQELKAICDQNAVRLDGQLHPGWDTRGMDGKMLRDAGLVNVHDWEAGGSLLGCALAHSELWMGLAEDDGVKLGGTAGSLLILEDDAVINTARPVGLMLREILARVSKYDLVLLGAQEDRNYIEECSKNAPPKWVSNHLIRVHFFGGFWGYLISARGARRALHTLWGSTGFPKPLEGDCDIVVAGGCLRGELKAALCVPNLVLHPGWFGNCALHRNGCVGYEYVVDAQHLVEMGAKRSGETDGVSQRLEYVRERDKVHLPVERIHHLLRRCRELAENPGPPPPTGENYGLPGDKRNEYLTRMVRERFKKRQG